MELFSENSSQLQEVKYFRNTGGVIHSYCIELMTSIIAMPHAAQYRRVNSSGCFYRNTLEIQRQPTEVFYKKLVPKNLVKFTGKRLCQSFFFNKVASLRPATY